MGKCCNLNVLLTHKDFENLKNKTSFEDFKKYGNLIVHWGTCPFLEKENGCTLPEPLKPFDCKLFPLTFMYEDSKVKIFLNKKCPFTKEIPQEWINKTKSWLKKELQSWKKQDLLAYSSLIEKHSSSRLVLLEEFVL